MERHPLGSQAFVPLQDRPWLVVVCAAPDDLASYRAFTATGLQGVNYARNVWHHPLLVLDAAAASSSSTARDPETIWKNGGWISR